MKRIGLILLFSLIASIAVAAQEKAKPEAPKSEAPKNDAKAAAGAPTVDEILDKFVKAIGGKEAIEKVNSRSSKGSFEMEAMNMTGTFESFAKAPNKSAMTITIPNFGNINNVFDGTKAWAADPMSGLRELSGAELATTRREADFYAPLNFKKNYTKLEVKGKEKVGSGEAYVIEATPAEGTSEKYYFDATTGLLARHDTERDTPQGKMAMELYFEDYKPVDGLKVAHTLRQVSPMFSLSIKFAEVKHNSAIDEKAFAKPSGN